MYKLIIRGPALYNHTPWTKCYNHTPWTKCKKEKRTYTFLMIYLISLYWYTDCRYDIYRVIPSYTDHTGT